MLEALLQWFGRKSIANMTVTIVIKTFYRTGTVRKNYLDNNYSLVAFY